MQIPTLACILVTGVYNDWRRHTEQKWVQLRLVALFGLRPERNGPFHQRHHHCAFSSIVTDHPAWQTLRYFELYEWSGSWALTAAWELGHDPLFFCKTMRLKLIIFPSLSYNFLFFYCDNRKFNTVYSTWHDIVYRYTNIHIAWTSRTLEKYSLPFAAHWTEGRQLSWPKLLPNFGYSAKKIFQKPLSFTAGNNRNHSVGTNRPKHRSQVSLSCTQCSLPSSHWCDCH